MSEQRVAGRERPIIMTGESVRAILSGAKTQTRRIVTPLPPSETTDFAHLGGDEWTCIGNNGPNRRCPYGADGNRLWVRETWAEERDVCCDDDPANFSWIHYRATPHVGMRTGDRARITYLHESATEERIDEHVAALRWRSPIHMPSAFSRLALEITSVRVERLQDISEADALAEGVEPDDSDMRRWGPYKSSFAFLWQRINAKRGYGWNVNPFVWVVGFRAIPDSATEARGEHAPSHPTPEQP